MTTPSTFQPLDPDRFTGLQDGRPIGLFALESPGGLRAGICSHGARLLQLGVPGRGGNRYDVVLGHDSLAQVLAGLPSMGAFIGRYANRIGGARFVLDGQAWSLPANLGPHCIHGGPQGSRHQVFAVTEHRADSLALAWTFLQAQDGFPGDVSLQLRYTLRDPGTLAIEYAATAHGRATVLNLTPHPYFNLEGPGSADVGRHRVTLEAAQVLVTDSGRIPTGQRRPVAGTPLDLRAGQPLAEAIAGLAEDLDHCYVLDPPQRAQAGLRRAARVHADASGIAMEVWCDTGTPGLQCYACGGLDASLPRHAGKGGRAYGPGAALCLEPQQFPDAPNQPGFPSTVLAPGQSRSGCIEYRFSCED